VARVDYAARMGHPDQWLKAVLADETPELTGRAAVFETAPEIRTTELQPDGLLRTTTPAALHHLAPPWSLLRHEAVFEGKMPGDHLGPDALQRCSFRREARQAQRLTREAGKARVDPNPEDCAAWVLAPHVAAWLRAWERSGRLTLVPAGAGCWWVKPSAYPMLWIAANELPLREELIPFLAARTGAKLAEFIAWVHTRRTPAWLYELMYARPEVAPMIRSMEDQLTPEAEAFIVASFRGSKLAKKLGAEERSEGRNEGLGAVEHLFARRLGRAVTPTEHAELLRRLGTLGAARIGDVVLDLAPEALAAWLADPNAT